MDADDMKRHAAAAALTYVAADMVLGVGTGSTAEHFIELLAASPVRISAAVPSSARTEARLRAAGLPIVGLEAAPAPALYVDGADEVDPQLRLVKGHGGAHTREKVLATASTSFVCIVDEGKLVRRLGTAPVPLEILPVALGFVARVLSGGGAHVTVRQALSEDGNLLVDVDGLDLESPEEVEVELETIPGVVACGLFARRRPDLVVVGRARGADVIRASRPPLAPNRRTP
jgi:ribose 5-phosphate isomerase A